MICAALRHTAYPTMLDAGYKANVIPSSAEATIDCRVLPGRPQHAPTVVVAVLEVAAYSAGDQEAVDQLLGAKTVAGLDVGRDRHVHHAGDASDPREHLIGRRALVIRPAERRGHAATCRGHNGKAGVHHRAGAGRVPGVRQNQGMGAPMQGPQPLRPRR